MRCANIYPSGDRCEQSVHLRGTEFCWQHDPANAQRRSEIARARERRRRIPMARPAALEEAVHTGASE